MPAVLWLVLLAFLTVANACSVPMPSATPTPTAELDGQFAHWRFPLGSKSSHRLHGRRRGHDMVDILRSWFGDLPACEATRARGRNRDHSR